MGSSTGHLLAVRAPAARQAKSFGEVSSERLRLRFHLFRIRLKELVIKRLLRNPVSAGAAALHRRGALCWVPLQPSQPGCCCPVLTGEPDNAPALHATDSEPGQRPGQAPTVPTAPRLHCSLAGLLPTWPCFCRVTLLTPELCPNAGRHSALFTPRQS